MPTDFKPKTSSGFRNLQNITLSWRRRSPLPEFSGGTGSPEYVTRGTCQAGKHGYLRRAGKRPPGLHGYKLASHKMGMPGTDFSCGQQQNLMPRTLVGTLLCRLGRSDWQESLPGRAAFLWHILFLLPSLATFLPCSLASHGGFPLELLEQLLFTPARGLQCCNKCLYVNPFHTAFSEHMN